MTDTEQTPAVHWLALAIENASAAEGAHTSADGIPSRIPEYAQMGILEALIVQQGELRLQSMISYLAVLTGLVAAGKGNPTMSRQIAVLEERISEGLNL